MSILTMIQNWVSRSAATRPRSHSRSHGGFSLDLRSQGRRLKKNESSIPPDRQDSTAYEIHLPQSADDKTIMRRTETILDQIDDYIENYYRKSPSSVVELSDVGIANLEKLDTGLLPRKLPSIASEAKNMKPIAKHTLAHVITSSISTTIRSPWPLLPSDFVLIPRAVESTETDARHRRGKRLTSSHASQYICSSDISKL